MTHYCIYAHLQYAVGHLGRDVEDAHEKVVDILVDRSRVIITVGVTTTPPVDR